MQLLAANLEKNKKIVKLSNYTKPTTYGKYSKNTRFNTRKNICKKQMTGDFFEKIIRINIFLIGTNQLF